MLSGGKVNRSAPGPTLAQAMRDFLVELGADPADLRLEAESTTTYENAVNTQKLLATQRISRVFIVIDAASMRRARGCFLAQGMETIPAPR